MILNYLLVRDDQQTNVANFSIRFFELDIFTKIVKTSDELRKRYIKLMKKSL